MNKFNVNKKIMGAAITIMLANIFFMILVFQQYLFHSDDAGFVFYAEEMAKQHRLFPERFHYTTEVFGFGPSHFMTFFVGLTSNKILLHEMGSIAIILFWLVIGVLAFRKNEKVGFTLLLMTMIPYSSTYRDMMFFQAAYTMCSVWIFLFILIANFFIDDKSNRKRLALLDTIKILIFLIAINFVSYRSVFYIIAPSLIAYACYSLLENGIDLRNKHLYKKNIIKLLLYLVMIVISLIIYKYNMYRIGFSYSAVGFRFLTWEEFLQNVTYFFKNSMYLMGCIVPSRLISFGTVRFIPTFVVYLAIFWIGPIYCLLNIKKVNNSKDRFIILFCFFSQLVQNTYFIIFGASTDRYFMTVLFVDFILFAYAIGVISSAYYTKGICVLLLIALAYIGGEYAYSYIHGHLSVDAIKSILNPRTESSDITDYLLENDYKYGYAKFWTGYPVSFSSNGELEIAAFDKDDPLLPYFFDDNSYDNINYYGCSEDLYNPELHKGKCFILVNKDESIPQIYYDLANNVVEINQCQILTYDKNINEYFHEGD